MQEEGTNGRVVLTDLNPDDSDFEVLSQKLHPMEKVRE